MAEENPSFSESAELYMIGEAFARKDQYVFRTLQRNSFARMYTNGILYRPDIVNEIMGMIERALHVPIKAGVMITGPSGVGKSHSLINLVRKLLYGSNMKYHVVFIPDCQDFKEIGDLYEAVCHSFGSSMEELRFDVATNAREFREFIERVQLVLNSKMKEKMKWVFIFDQANAILRPGNSFGSRFRDVDIPWYTIQDVMGVGDTVSIISVSEVDYAPKQGFFSEYNHPPCMTRNEACCAFPILHQMSQQGMKHDVVDLTMKISGGVPLHILRLSLILMKFWLENCCPIEFLLTCTTWKLDANGRTS